MILLLVAALSFAALHFPLPASAFHPSLYRVALFCCTNPLSVQDPDSVGIPFQFKNRIAKDTDGQIKGCRFRTHVLSPSSKDQSDPSSNSIDLDVVGFVEDDNSVCPIEQCCDALSALLVHKIVVRNKDNVTQFCHFSREVVGTWSRRLLCQTVQIFQIHDLRSIGTDSIRRFCIQCCMPLTCLRSRQMETCMILDRPLMLTQCRITALLLTRSQNGTPHSVNRSTQSRHDAETSLVSGLLDLFHRLA